MLENFLIGWNTAIHLPNLGYSLLGVFIGNLIGVLPGIGALAAISMLLPLTYALSPVASIMMLAGIYYGTSFGGATTSILLNLPGTATHAVVCLDGYPLAKKGQAGPAIFMAMFASFIGVLIAVLIMFFFSDSITRIALQFGAEEYFSLMLLGLVAASMLASGSALKGLAAVVIGLMIGTIGVDINTGVPRFQFGLIKLQDGISLVALALGLFGVMDVLLNAGTAPDGELNSREKITSRSVCPSMQQIRSSMGAIWRGVAIGSTLGALPGTGGTLASFMSYATEKRVAKDPTRFGKGAIEGVAGPEAANSSGAITAFIPTLTLGIPGDAVMALILGALMIQNITPGPMVIVNQPELFWGLIISFLIGNLFLVILNIPFIQIWVKLLSVPYRIIFPIVLLLVCLGVFSENNDIFDVAMVTAIGAFGALTYRLGFEPAPVLLGYILGPMMEENFRRAIAISNGSLSTFLTHPISAACLLFCLALVMWVGYGSWSKRVRYRKKKNSLELNS